MIPPNSIEQVNWIIGDKDREERIATAEALALHYAQKFSAKIYRLPENIKSSDRYLKAAANVLPIEGGKGSDLHYLDDMQLDWVRFKNNTPAIVLIPELQGLLKNDPHYFYQLIAIYLTKAMEMAEMLKDKNAFRFVVTVAKIPEDLFDRMRIFIGRGSGDSRSEKEIAMKYMRLG